MSNEERYEKALKEITKLGRVCPEFEICDHVACSDSCGAFLIAIDAINNYPDKEDDK